MTQPQLENAIVEILLFGTDSKRGELLDLIEVQSGPDARLEWEKAIELNKQKSHEHTQTR